MSVIGRTPFIDKIVNNLDKSGVLSLASLLNNLGSATTVSLKSINDSNKGVSHVIFNLDELQNKNVEGILIYSDATHCGLFVFDTTSGNMYEYEIDPTNKTYIQIYEHLTVEELRQIVSDSLIEKGEAVSIQADDIDSGNATSGKVLTADGDGGASWESVSATQLYKHTVTGTCVASDDQSYDFSGVIICTKSTALTSNELDSMLFNGNQYNPVSISMLFGTGPFLSYLTYDGNVELIDSSQENPIVTWYGLSSMNLTNDTVVAI